MSLFRKITPLTISLLFSVIGASWIYFTNNFFEIYHIQGKPHALIESLQEFIFIFITGILLFLLLKKYKTQLEKSNTELKDKGLLYRTLLENGGDIVGMTDHNGNIKYLGNDAVFNILGYSKKEMLKTSVFNLLHPDDLEKCNNFHQILLETPDKLFIDEFRIIQKNGDYIWIEAKCINYLNNPAINGIVNNITVIQERKRAEEELLKQKNFYETILHKFPADIIVFDEDHRTVFCNQIPPEAKEAKLNAMGIKEADACPILLRFPELAALRENNFRESITTNKDISWEETVPEPDESNKYYWRHYSPIQLDTDAPVILSFGIDITGRRVAEEKLKEGEAKNKAILAAIPDLFMIVNNEGKYIYSKEVEEYTFTKDSQFIGRTIFEILPPALANKAWLHIGQAFHTGNLQVFEYELILDKKFQCLETRIIMLSQKEVLVMVRNITEQHESGLKIKESETLFRSTFEQAAVGIVHVGLDFKRIRINDQFCKIIGYDKDELFITSLKDISHPDDYENEQPLIHQLLTNEIDNYQMEKRYIRKDGTTIWTNITVSIARNETGEAKYFIVVIQDISNKKLMEQALEYKNKELNTFIYRVSHDLRGPIASLMGLTEVAKYEIKDDTSTNIMHKISVTANKLDATLVDLIDITKIQQGKIITHPINFVMLTDEIISSLAYLHNCKKVNFNNKITCTASFQSDLAMVRSILQNLIENSIKYAKDDETYAETKVEIAEVNAGVEIKVSDNGIGIKNDAHDKIFDMFYRATDKSKGTGLGLYIVKSATEKLGGKINFISQENTGTTFTVFLPDLTQIN